MSQQTGLRYDTARLLLWVLAVLRPRGWLFTRCPRAQGLFGWIGNPGSGLWADEEAAVDTAGKQDVRALEDKYLAKAQTGANPSLGLKQQLLPSTDPACRLWLSVSATCPGALRTGCACMLWHMRAFAVWPSCRLVGYKCK